MPVAITIDAIFENVPGQHLHHANLASPSARCGRRIKITLLEKFQRGKYLWSEQLWPAAIIGAAAGFGLRGIAIATGLALPGYRPEPEDD